MPAQAVVPSFARLQAEPRRSRGPMEARSQLQQPQVRSACPSCGHARFGTPRSDSHARALLRRHPPGGSNQRCPHHGLSDGQVVQDRAARRAPGAAGGPRCCCSGQYDGGPGASPPTPSITPNSARPAHSLSSGLRQCAVCGSWHGMRRKAHNLLRPDGMLSCSPACRVASDRRGWRPRTFMFWTFPRPTSRDGIGASHARVPVKCF